MELGLTIVQGDGRDKVERTLDALIHQYQLKFCFRVIKSVQTPDRDSINYAVNPFSLRAPASNIIHVCHSFDEPLLVIDEQYLRNVEYFQQVGEGQDRDIVHLRIAVILCREIIHLLWKFRLKGVMLSAPGHERCEPRNTQYVVLSGTPPEDNHTCFLSHCHYTDL
jgi:hypothetical protein